MEQNNLPTYEMKGVSDFINKAINFLFYYRLPFVVLCLIFLIYIEIHIWLHYPTAIRMESEVGILTGGSIIIGIFYSILNYEFNHLKNKNDARSTRAMISFNAAFEWHKQNIVENMKITKACFKEHSHFLDENNSQSFVKVIEENDKIRSALNSIFNYLECISIAIDHDIMDKKFIKQFFKTIFKDYVNEYQFYIDYKRKKQFKEEVWINFTNLAQDWSLNKD